MGFIRRRRELYTSHQSDSILFGASNLPVIIAAKDKAAHLAAQSNVDVIGLFRKNVPQYVVAHRKLARKLAPEFLIDEHEFTLNLRANKLKLQRCTDSITIHFRHQETLFHIESELCPADKPVEGQCSVANCSDNSKLGIMGMQAMDDLDIS